MIKALLCVALAVSVCACKGGGEEPASEVPAEATKATSPLAPAQPQDAGTPPTGEAAGLVLQAFSDKLLGNDLVGAKEHLRVPSEFRDKQVDYFLQELQSPTNLSKAGVEAVLLSEFGPLSERFGEQAEPVAAKIGLPVETIYAFGDTDAAALLHWDGKKFQVAAVHKLAAPRK